MSICGNCHYNWHSDTECNYDCTSQDAVYREQMAYDSLRESFDDIVDKYNKLVEWCQTGKYDLPFWLEPYTEEESKTRDAMLPMFWTRRDWLAYHEEIKPTMNAIEALVKAGEIYPVSAEEFAAAIEIAEQKIIDASGVPKEVLNNDN